MVVACVQVQSTQAREIAVVPFNTFFSFRTDIRFALPVIAFTIQDVARLQ